MANYYPKPLPNILLTKEGLVDGPALQNFMAWVESELGAIANYTAETKVVELRVSNVEPQKPRDGILVVADGTTWDPGGGAGFYVRLSGAWKKVTVT